MKTRQVFLLTSYFSLLTLSLFSTLALASPSALTPGWARARALYDHAHSIRPVVPPYATRLTPHATLPDSDIIVGYPDSNEVRTITGSYTHPGRIIVLNNGTLILDHANFTLRGMIYVLDHGKMRVRGGSLTFQQSYAYEYGAMAFQAGEFSLDSATVYSSNQSWSMGAMDSAQYNVRNSTLRNGFNTVALVGKPRVTYFRSDFASEYVILDSARLSLTRCDTALIWLSFPDSSIVSLTLPGADTTLKHWEIHPGSPGVSGIKYTVTVDTVSGVMWGTFPQKGCRATITNSKIRASGVMIPGRDSVHVSGLVNNQRYTDYTLPLGDRTYRLVNTDHMTWNLYPQDSTRFVLETSIFGEMLGYGSPRVTVNNSICDGSGGYIGSEGNTQYIVVGSTIYTQVISRDRSFMILAGSHINFGAVNATDASAMLLLFSTSDYYPVARDTALIFVSNYTIPSNASVESTVPVTGTADILHGPAQPVTFGNYRMLFAPADTPSAMRFVGPSHNQVVVNDTLDLWDTHGLRVGAYILRMRLRDSANDSLDFDKGVYLNPSGVELQPTLTNLPNALSFSQPAPNPFSSRTAIAYALPAPGRVALKVYNLQGQWVRTLLDEDKVGGTYEAQWDALNASGQKLSPGIYFLRLTAPQGSLTRKVVLTR